MRAIGAMARRAAGALEGFLLESPPGADEPAPAAGLGTPAGQPAPSSPRATPPVVLATAIGTSGGSASLAAAVGVAAAERGSGGVLLVDLEVPARGRGPTVLASDRARELEDRVRALGGPCGAAAARGRLCYLPLGRDGGGEAAGGEAAGGEAADAGGEGDPLGAVARVLDAELGASAAIVHLHQSLWPRAVADPRLRARSALIRAELPADRALAALAVRELHARGLRAKVASRPLGIVASRRALAGIDPTGAASGRAARLARALVGDRDDRDA